MSINELKRFEELKHEWLQYDEDTKKMEYMIYETRNLKVIKYLEKAKNEFSQYFLSEAKFNVLKQNNRIFASYNDLKFEIYFEEPNFKPVYNFVFIIKGNPRVEYFIPIVPLKEILLPILSIHRKQPKSKDLLELEIIEMREEYLRLDRVKEKIKSVDFCYLCYNSQNLNPVYSKMVKFSSFIDLLNSKLK